MRVALLFLHYPQHLHHQRLHQSHWLQQFLQWHQCLQNHWLRQYLLLRFLQDPHVTPEIQYFRFL